MLVAVVSLALVAWRYRENTRHMRELARAASLDDSLSPEARAFWQELAWNREAWESGLVHRLGEVPNINSPSIGDLALWLEFHSRVCWEGRYVDADDSIYRVFLFPEMGISSPPRHRPLTCVVTDDDCRLRAWKVIAERCSLFESATIESHSPPVLQITCWGHPIGVQGSYRYYVSPEAIDELEEPTWEMVGIPVDD